MNVIWHHLIFPQFGVWKLAGYFFPNIVGNLTQCRKMHFPIRHISKTTFSMRRTNGNEIRPVVGIIPPRRTCGLYPVFSGKFFHCFFLVCYCYGYAINRVCTIAIAIYRVSYGYAINRVFTITIAINRVFTINILPQSQHHSSSRTPYRHDISQCIGGTKFHNHRQHQAVGIGEFRNKGWRSERVTHCS